jgi:hypothetical protein
VLSNLEKALKSNEEVLQGKSMSDLRGIKLDEHKKLSLRLASLLHDADDRKIFPNSGSSNLNSILKNSMKEDGSLSDK